MKNARELYADDMNADFFFGFSDYQPMLNEFGDIVVQVDQSDYQGDSWLLYKKDEKIGYLNFGWGSCSGCDALQGCGTIEEVQQLMDSLHSSVQWFDSASAALDHFNGKDWSSDYSWYYEDFKEFIEKAKAALSGLLE